MRPRRRSILWRSFNRQVWMVRARRCKASSMWLEKRLLLAFLFFLAALGTAQDISLLALADRHLLDFHFGPHLNPVVLQQLLFQLLHLAARCAHQILAAPFVNRRQVLLTANDPIVQPEP